MLNYVVKRKPRFIIGGPPCTAFSNLSRLNRVIHPDSCGEQRRVGLSLARLMAELMVYQRKRGKFYIVENPAQSEMWNLPEFRRIWEEKYVGAATFPQCGLGLRTPEGLPILKYTTLWSNSPFIIHQFMIRGTYEKSVRGPPGPARKNGRRNADLQTGNWGALEGQD